MEFCDCRRLAWQKGNVFFDRNADPEVIVDGSGANAVCHVFEKLLRIKGMMLTAAGRVESEGRHEILVEFLEHLFVEDDAPEWSRYLKEYLRKLPE